ncbi:MAG: NUDIX hydrolase [Chloroflexi bacterium]|nr:NUDIX hydrolase [Chloroflexota bacterium]
MQSLAARIRERIDTFNSGVIRGLAICVFRDGNRILVGEGYDPIKRETFYRPLGGTIEFGERAEETIARELREEIGAEVEGLKFLGVLENIFTFAGKPGHEIVFVYDGKLSDRSLYARAELIGVEIEEGGASFKAVWKSLDEFDPVRAPVYPDGLVELLKNQSVLLQG